jgi:hypothetical protein
VPCMHAQCCGLASQLWLSPSHRSLAFAAAHHARFQQVLSTGLRPRQAFFPKRVPWHVTATGLCGHDCSHRLLRPHDALGKHALGDRARKLSQGVLITRFELPFNIWWCALRLLSSYRFGRVTTSGSGTCDAHIGMGVRYNAEKRKVGNYFSTPIYAFRCKCHLCSGWFEVQTDPKVRRLHCEHGGLC